MSLVTARVLLFVTLTALASVVAQSRFNEVKQATSIVTTEVTYTPPMMILGKSNGSIVRCPVAKPINCEEFHAGNSLVSATAVHGEFLFATLKNGDVLRCVWQRPHSCVVFHRAGSEANGLAVAAGFLHVGLRNGTILRCELATPHSCSKFASLEHDIYSLAAIGSVLYVGSEHGQIESCSISSKNCKLFCDPSALSNIVGLAGIGDRIFGMRHLGAVQSGVVASSKCDEVNNVFDDSYTSMAVYNRKLYMIKDPGEIHIFDSSTFAITNQLYARLEGIKSISFSYGTHAIQSMYRMESEKCIWKGVFQCPPTVFHYEVQDRLALEITVKDGRLHDSQGALVDTSQAEEVHSQRAAVFAMGPDGQLLLSSYHRAGLLHASSLLAGHPVAGAGLMVVQQGRIVNITACSVHYRPDQDLNAQVIESLYQKGYTDPIESHDCNYGYSEMLCGQSNFIDNTRNP